MYICLCNQVTDKAIKRAIEGGCDDLSALQQELNVSTQCGTCVGDVLRLVEESQTSPQITTTHVSKNGFTIGFCVPEACF